MNESKENQLNRKYVGYAQVVEDRQEEEQGSNLTFLPRVSPTVTVIKDAMYRLC